jgi:hypothetical protein
LLLRICWQNDGHVKNALRLPGGGIELVTLLLQHERHGGRIPLLLIEEEEEEKLRNKNTAGTLRSTIQSARKYK